MELSCTTAESLSITALSLTRGGVKSDFYYKVLADAAEIRLQRRTRADRLVVRLRSRALRCAFVQKQSLIGSFGYTLGPRSPLLTP